jgi:dGTPase
MIAPSAEIAEQKREMEQFLLNHVYRHPNVMVYRRRVSDWVETIFDYYAAHPERLPERYGTIMQQEGACRAAADYVADQTDRSIRAELLKLHPRRII